MSGELFQPQNETMARIHYIRNITPGAIATCGILVCCYHPHCQSNLSNACFQARWALSGDEILQEVGSSTGIRYFNDYEEYLTILETGLRQKKKSIINIVQQWDEKIFPNSNSSLSKGKNGDESGGLKKLMDSLEDDSEVEDNQVEHENGNGSAGALQTLLCV